MVMIPGRRVNPLQHEVVKNRKEKFDTNKTHKLWTLFTCIEQLHHTAIERRIKIIY